ncbi:hypothetical protein NDU88_007160 [Pleurodeles waltl]|uniref:Uncharacterized protein n=1 Tax=Pleurodeles waltl TaxID=8319 RepID=A0AAV7RTZ5_PLEWA|nr:hypothetical protein NDU88_007160 [Pleurodeles waltl]
MHEAIITRGRGQAVQNGGRELLELRVAPSKSDALGGDKGAAPPDGLSALNPTVLQPVGAEIRLFGGTATRHTWSAPRGRIVERRGRGGGRGP